MNDMHLGDGVYVSYDGYQLWLAANHHENKVIALEPDVLRSLIRYVQRLGDAALLAAVRPADYLDH